MMLFRWFTAATPTVAMLALVGGCQMQPLPDSVRQGQRLTGMDYEMPMASAQVKSCLLLAGLYAAGSTSVTEPAPTRDHTERMLRGFGYPVSVEGSTASVESGHKLTATRIEVPADISSAAFFLVAASIAPGSDLVLEHVGMNPTRVGVINILRAMGGDLYFHRPRPEVIAIWRRTGFDQRLGDDHLFPDKATAIAAIVPRLDGDICAKCGARIFKECKSRPKLDHNGALS